MLERMILTIDTLPCCIFYEGFLLNLFLIFLKFVSQKWKLQLGLPRENVRKVNSWDNIRGFHATFYDLIAFRAVTVH